MTPQFDGLAATGSNLVPWLIVAGVVVLLGVIALVVAGVLRSRRSEREVEDAAETVAASGRDLPVPDANASASDETILQEAQELNHADSTGGSEGHDAVSNPLESDPAELAPNEEFAPNLGPVTFDIDAPADTSWPADGESYPRTPEPGSEGSESAEPTPPFTPPAEDDDPGK